MSIPHNERRNSIDANSSYANPIIFDQFNKLHLKAVIVG